MAVRARLRYLPRCPETGGWWKVGGSSFGCWFALDLLPRPSELSEWGTWLPLNCLLSPRLVNLFLY